MESYRQAVLERAVGEYSAKLVSPWVHHPDFVTIRHPESGKWFGLVMNVTGDLIGLDSEEELDILNVKADPALIASLSKDEGYAPAYHMNKKHWITVRLDGSVPLDNVIGLLDMSYQAICPKSFASSSAVRKCMKGNTCKDTKPEMQVRKILRELGHTGYRLQWKKCPGRPDVAFPGRKLAIYVNGCFWHRHEGCKHATQPKTNLDYWNTKFENNVARDKRNLAAAKEQGWKTLVIWECELKKDRIESTRDVIHEFIILSEGESSENHL